MDGNLEIEKALEEFEQSAQKEQVIKTVAKEKLDEPSRMIKLVMKYSGGAIKEERQAEYVLLSFAILFFLISFYLFFGDYLSRKLFPPPIVPDEEEMMNFEQ